MFLSILMWTKLKLKTKLKVKVNFKGKNETFKLFFNKNITYLPNIYFSNRSVNECWNNSYGDATLLKTYFVLF